MRVETMVALGELLKRRRMAAGLTQEALAVRAGLSRRTIGALERGMRRLPRSEGQGLGMDEAVALALDGHAESGQGQ